MIGRREVVAGAIVGVAALAGGRAEACSLTADRRVPFSDRICRRALEAWVELLNAGPDTPLEQVTERVDEMSVIIDQEMVEYVLGDRMNESTGGEYIFHKEFRLSGGRPDPRPIRIDELNLIRRLRNRATYQFTLERYSYHPADWEGCNGMFTHGEYYGMDRTSYLAAFHNNRLRSVRLFPEWYLEERG